MNALWSEMAKRAQPYTAGEQGISKNGVKLNTNENPYPPSSDVFIALQQAMTADLRKYPDPNASDLRTAIASLHNVSVNHVFIGNGSDEVLAFAYMAFFNPQREIRFPKVTYSFYPTYAELFHIPYEKVPLQKDFALHEEAFYESVGGVIFPNPNAPTGIALSLEAIERIVQKNEGRLVIIDEAYIDFGGETAISLLPLYPNILIIRTMSKSRSLAGLRIGYAIGSPELIEALNRIKNSINSYTVDQLAQAAGKAAIKDTVYFKETVDTIIHTREQSRKMFDSLGFTVLPSAANFLFVRHPKVPAEVLFRQLKENDILVRHFTQPETVEWLRISIGTDKEMERLFFQVHEIVNAWTVSGMTD